MSIYLTQGFQPDQPDDRDYVYSSSTFGLPASVDLRPFAGSIENQLNTNSCTANAGVSTLEILESRNNIQIDLGRLFLYWNTREYALELRGKDGGAYMRDICKALAEYGVCKESTWDFVASQVNTKPSQASYDEATKRRALKYERIFHINWALVKAALGKGYPVIVGMTLKEPFFNVTGPLSSHMQYFISKGYTSAPTVGSHAMVIVGYDDSTASWIIENSWGSGWGDNGYVAFPYGFFNLYVHDLWVITEYSNAVLPELWTEPTPVPLVFESIEPAAVICTQSELLEDSGFTKLDIKVTGGNPPYFFDCSSKYFGRLNNGTRQPTVVTNFSSPVLTDTMKIVVTDSSFRPQTVQTSISVQGIKWTKPEPVIPDPIPIDPVPPTPIEPIPIDPVPPVPEPVTPVTPNNNSSNSAIIAIVIVICIALFIFSTRS